MAQPNGEGESVTLQPTENERADGHRQMKRFRTTGDDSLDPEMMGMELQSTELPLDSRSGMRVSWRDTLVLSTNGKKEAASTEYDLESLDEEYGLDENLDCTVTRGNLGPSFSFSDRAMAKMCAPWKNSLIVKLIGRSHTLNFLAARLKLKWRPKGGMNIVDLVNNYFIVSFDLKEDRDFVLTGGPWIITGQYLVMQEWKPSFNAATAQTTRMAVWIRVSGVYSEFLDQWALKKIGSHLGKLLKIDSLTLKRARGQFARICVELDLSKPLEAFVELNQCWFNLEYEGLPDICFKCGLYGHKKEGCTTQDEMGKKSPEKGDLGTNVQPAEVLAAPPLNTEPSEDIPRGAWMQVQPRRRPKKQEKPSDQRGNDTRNGSRFSVLDSDEVNHGNTRNQNRGNVYTTGIKNDIVSPSLIFGSPSNSNSLEPNATKKWTPKKKNLNSTPRQPLGQISNILKSSAGTTTSDKTANCSKRPIVNNSVNATHQTPLFSFGDRATIAFVNDENAAKDGCMKSTEQVETHHKMDSLIAGHKPPNIFMVSDHKKETLPCSSVPSAYPTSREELMEGHESDSMEDIVSDPILERPSEMESSFIE